MQWTTYTHISCWKALEVMLSVMASHLELLKCDKHRAYSYQLGRFCTVLMYVNELYTLKLETNCPLKWKDCGQLLITDAGFATYTMKCYH